MARRVKRMLSSGGVSVKSGAPQRGEATRDEEGRQTRSVLLLAATTIEKGEQTVCVFSTAHERALSASKG